ncbi:hypothetical protein [Arthrobacter sp. zg-Y1116]|uniref:hypothetical protein n=1 Tax=Arthrobacter sp. zg-Y1116 TaxID=2964611 RepID=UPI002107DE86|nr:hypothetical protein [Arthrobacter sp. zg-Y1116]MCQ1948111.1 hypothetical protein [Arthrobacter sp. zg-Y1116]
MLVPRQPDESGLGLRTAVVVIVPCALEEVNEDDDGVHLPGQHRRGPPWERMVRLWQETDPEQNAVDPVLPDTVPASDRNEVLHGQDGKRIVSLVHQDTPMLGRVAVFDVPTDTMT